MANCDALQGGGEGEEDPLGLLPLSLQLSQLLECEVTPAPCPGSLGVPPGPALRAASTASMSRPAVNKGCVLYYGQDDLWANQPSADNHLAREENDLTLQKFGSRKQGVCMCVCVCVCLCVCGVWGGGGVCLCVCMCVYVVCVYCLCVYVCVCVYVVCVYVCVCVYVVCVYVCVVFVCVCVCVLCV